MVSALVDEWMSTMTLEQKVGWHPRMILVRMIRRRASSSWSCIRPA
jgi:hypothetical protein